MTPLEKAAIAAAEVVRAQKEASLWFDGMAIARAVLMAVRPVDAETQRAGNLVQDRSNVCAIYTAMIDLILRGGE